MAENKKLSPQDMARLLAVASEKTGIPPRELMALLRGGDISAAAERLGLGSGAAELFAGGRAEELLQEPAVQQLLAKLLG